MSQQHHGRGLDRPSAGSIKRARQRAQAGLPREHMPPPGPPMADNNQDFEYNPTPLRPMPPSGISTSRAGRQAPPPPLNMNMGHHAPRPMRPPQWPLAGPPLSPVSPEAPPAYPPAPMRPQHPPQRPPRPSQVPAIVNELRMQEPTPVLRPRPHQGMPQAYLAATDEYQDPTSAPSSRYPSSSVGAIPEFSAPLPVASQIENLAPRRSINLGPPPSSRRGDSSFYSNASYVSPIPEESPRSRSHGSYASSAVMPDAWDPNAQNIVPDIAGSFYEESVTDKSRLSLGDDSGDESKLVRSASLGKRGKPALVTTRSPQTTQTGPRPEPTPMQSTEENSAYMDVSTSSSNALPSKYPTPTATPSALSERELSPGGMLNVHATTSLQDPEESVGAGELFRSGSRLSGMKRPPRLDMDAVKAAEARGSITSLPDLIRRATRLAAMMDKGKRPASRFENLSDFLDEKSDGRFGQKDFQEGKRRSGLSDMLNAFPSPAIGQDNGRGRGSWFRGTSWPLDPNRQPNAGDRGRSRLAYEHTQQGRSRPGRRCCGLPLWGFLLIVFLLLCAIAAAIVVPLEYFVFKNLGNHSTDSDPGSCDKTLQCLNGGTSVMYDGACACICTNGYTGADCSVGGSEACTTTKLASTDGSSDIENVTLGSSIPRLIADAQGNFSISLSGTAILAKFNSRNLSCIAQNSLVTLDGNSLRSGTGASLVEDKTEGSSGSSVVSRGASPKDVRETESNGSANFTLTEEAIDFARVAILYIMQQQEVENAQTAQTKLDQFVTSANNPVEDSQPVTEKGAANVDVGSDNSVDLVNLQVDITDNITSKGEVKKGVTRRSRIWRGSLGL